MTVRVQYSVEVDFLQETPECKGPRGWDEAAIVPVVVKPIPGDEMGVFLSFQGKNFRLGGKVVDAIYDIYQGEIPEGDPS